MDRLLDACRDDSGELPGSRIRSKDCRDHTACRTRSGWDCHGLYRRGNRG